MTPLSNVYGTRLTPREIQVRTLAAEGLTSKQIAAHLLISEYTVANHRKSILKKKGIKNIKELFT